MKEVLTEASADPGAGFFRFARDRETTYHLRESAYRASLSPRSDAAPINVRKSDSGSALLRDLGSGRQGEMEGRAPSGVGARPQATAM